VRLAGAGCEDLARANCLVRKAAKSTVDASAVSRPERNDYQKWTRSAGGVAS
jgi:hypothetical protein